MVCLKVTRNGKVVNVTSNDRGFFVRSRLETPGGFEDRRGDEISLV